MAEYEHIVHPFKPVCTPEAHVLVLGSLPSKLSRVNDFYYGNPRNRFWKVMAMMLGETEPQTIAEKRAMLEHNGVALWDVIAECDIKGSSDASIRNAKPVAIERVTSTCHLQAIFTNGRTAERLFNRYLAPKTEGIPMTCLPSTSPANAAWTLERLVARWSQALKPYL
jgi:TDG/mug DNA glycosylase family protein